MALNNILRLFLPKDKIFYEVFENIVANLKDMIASLRSAFEEKDIEKRNDKKKMF